MPLRDTFKALKSQWENAQGHQQYPGGNAQYGQQQYPGYPPQYPQQQYPSSNPQYQQQAPPIPHGSRPQQSLSQNSSVYWRPSFDPAITVSTEWDHKQGNGDGGWGNNELENYTSNAENSFHTQDGKLILRAVARPTDSDAGRKFTSARLVSRHRLARTRGSLTAVLTLPCASGIWPAFWCLPAEPFTWPHEGEVDIAETWNGDCNNKSCLHWGFFTGEDHWKHRTRGTDIHDMPQRPIKFDFVWNQSADGTGRMLWFVDEKPVMRAEIPQGIRRLSDWQILLNVAMGGNVCVGQIPAAGSYDLVVHQMYLSEVPEYGGWEGFEQHYANCPDGNMG